MFKGQSFKKFNRNVHLWLGLLTALPFFIVCLTGAILVFQTPIEDYIDSNSVYIQQEASHTNADINAVLKAYSQQYDIKPSRVNIPKEVNKAIRIYGRDRTTGTSVRAYYNPYTAEFTGERSEFIDQFFGTSLRLHRWLLVRGPGQVIVSVSTLLFLFISLSGIILWMPKKLKYWLKALSIDFKGSLKKINSQLHSVLSMYALVFLFLMAFSGVYIAENWFKDAVTIALGGTVDKVEQTNVGNRNNATSGNNQRADNHKGGRKKPVLPAYATADYASIIAQTDSILVYNSDKVLVFGNRPNSPIQVIKYKETNIGMKVSESVSFDAQTAAIVSVDLFADKPLAEKYRSINRNLHTGELFGTPLMTLYLLACIIGCLLTVTGILIWWWKRKKTKTNPLNEEIDLVNV